MNALAAQVVALVRRAGFGSKPLPEPEPFVANPRPLKGLFGQLSAAQRRAALDYRGDEDHGEPGFPLSRPR